MKGHGFAAVDKSSLGGWIVAWREFLKDGINPKNNFSSLSFLGTHDAVVHAVLKGEVDAGTVRTDTIERMADEGKIDIKHIRVLSSSFVQDRSNTMLSRFPFLLSTRLYPEWPMAKLSHVSDTLAEKLAFSLINMPKDSPAATDAKIAGWTIPKNYRDIDRAFQELKIGIYADLGDFSFWDSILKYWHAFLLGGVFFILMLITTLYILKLNSKLKESESHMREMATHDKLTGLPNRNLFLEFAAKALALASREEKKVAILFIDLDYFKQVNDTFGHQKGDELLHNVAKRLIKHSRREDLMARLGGDEFAGMLFNIKKLNELTLFTSRIIKDVSDSYFLSGDEITIGCSIGIAIFPEHGNDIEELLQQADEALYSVKKAGRGDVAIYDKSMAGNGEG